MILLKRKIERNVELHTFVVPVRTGKNNFAKSLGFVIDLTPSDARVVWLNADSIVSFISREAGRLIPINKLQIVEPYYKNESDQGEISKNSYLALFEALKYTDPKKLFNDRFEEPCEIKMIKYKNQAKENDKIRITSAIIAVKYKLASLNAKIINISKTAKTVYDVQLVDESLPTVICSLFRADFELVKQDTFTLADAKCPVCKRF